jgi:hypothetical protein
MVRKVRFLENLENKRFVFRGDDRTCEKDSGLN